MLKNYLKKTALCLSLSVVPMFAASVSVNAMEPGVHSLYTYQDFSIMEMKQEHTISDIAEGITADSRVSLSAQTFRITSPAALVFGTATGAALGQVHAGTTFRFRTDVAASNGRHLVRIVGGTPAQHNTWLGRDLWINGSVGAVPA